MIKKRPSVILDNPYVLLVRINCNANDASPRTESWRYQLRFCTIMHILLSVNKKHTHKHWCLFKFLTVNSISITVFAHINWGKTLFIVYEHFLYIQCDTEKYGRKKTTITQKIFEEIHWNKNEMKAYVFKFCFRIIDTKLFYFV